MATLCAEKVSKIPLWSADVPGRIVDGTTEITTNEGGIMRVATVHNPVLHAFPAAAENNCGAAVVICPGGGYGIVAIEHEGFDVARWFNTFGVSAFVLKYRMSPYRHPIPLLDAQQAMRIVRNRAAEWDIDTARLGVMGFSAGGHLASTVLTHGDRPAGTDLPLADVSCKADFAILGYPVISLVNKAICHQGSMNNLLGPNPGRQLLRELSAECQVTEKTAPVFMFHAKDDGGVPAENSQVLATQLRRAGVPTAVCLLDSGGHGFGLRRDEWTKPCIDWLREQGFLTPNP